MKNSPCECCEKECPTNGCKTWQQWWVDNWNNTISRHPPAKREAFLYEHPDRVREMENNEEE